MLSSASHQAKQIDFLVSILQFFCVPLQYLPVFCSSVILPPPIATVHWTRKGRHVRLQARHHRWRLSPFPSRFVDGDDWPGRPWPRRIWHLHVQTTLCLYVDFGAFSSLFVMSHEFLVMFFRQRKHLSSRNMLHLPRHSLERQH